MVPYSIKLEMLEKVVGNLQNVDNHALKNMTNCFLIKKIFLACFNAM
ncbi:hypothetical protein OTSUT76_0249 [Orientia tsutsugamushi str. UT76]|nr:hypothetical protein OTSUT76_0249 [Orientia tsutsugamushi str. UT76]